MFEQGPQEAGASPCHGCDLLCLVWVSSMNNFPLTFFSTCLYIWKSFGWWIVDFLTNICRYSLHCSECGVIYKSRQLWWGNIPPEKEAVTMMNKHVWPGVSLCVFHEAHMIRFESNVMSAEMMLMMIRRAWDTREAALRWTWGKGWLMGWSGCLSACLPRPSMSKSGSAIKSILLTGNLTILSRWQCGWIVDGGVSEWVGWWRCGWMSGWWRCEWMVVRNESNYDSPCRAVVCARCSFLTSSEFTTAERVAGF